MENNTLIAIAGDFWSRLQFIFTNPFSLIFFLGFLITVFLGLRWLRRNFTSVQNASRTLGEKIGSIISPERHEARLNQVVCPNCKTGKGILNPVYIVYQNEPHVEGTCSDCGHFVRTPVR